MTGKVYITDYIVFPEIEKKILGKSLSVKKTNDIEILLVWNQVIDESYLKQFPKLKAIVRYGVGFDKINKKDIEKINLIVCNTPDYASDEVSDTALAYLMMITRGVLKYDNDSNKWILSNVCLEINKGEIIGIYGETGSGKSTFIDLFSGLILPSKGEILVDSDQLNINIDKSWKEKLTYVPQSIFLIDASIRENILFGNEEKEFDEAKFNSVIEKAQLNQVISKLPDGIESIVGERGLSLSGGERQRIGIARALYRDTDVMIFDESTNSLDMETEKKIINEIIKYKGQKTILMIAHRLSTLNECDRFYNVLDGNVLEDKSFLTNE